MMDFDAFDNFDFTDANESIPSLNGSAGPEPCEVGSASDGSVSFVFNGKSSASDGDFPNDIDVSSLSDPVDTDEKRISSADSSDLSDWSDDDDVDVEFLIAKRRILKRVAHVFESEDCYVASIAKKHIVDTPAAIWTDAKEIMSALTEKTGHRQVRFAPTTKTVKRQDPIVKHIRKKPRIDVSSVNLVDARDFVSPTKNFQPRVEERPESLCGDSKWMIKALQQHYDMPTSHLPSSASSHSASSSDEAECQKVLSSKMDFTSQGTTLEDALAITTKPKILSQGKPPFLVVHANKAFFGFSELSSKDVIGKPVEEVIKMGKNTDDLHSLANNAQKPGFTNGTLGDKTCQIQVKPVATPAGSMSHVLVQVQRQGSFNAGLVGNGSLASRNKHCHVLVGTVG